MVIIFCYLCHYLLVRFEGPVTLNSRVTEVLHLPQHGCHEGGPQLPCVCAHPLPLLISDVLPLLVLEVLSYPRVIDKGRQVVKKITATIHVPVHIVTAL